MLAVTCVALTNVVGRGLPFQSTTDAGTNPMPLTVKEKLVPPAAALVGEMEVIVGVGDTCGFVTKVKIFLVVSGGLELSRGTIPNLKVPLCVGVPPKTPVKLFTPKFWARLNPDCDMSVAQQQRGATPPVV